MPWMQAFVGRLNDRFNAQNIGSVNIDVLKTPGMKLGDTAQKSTGGTAPIKATNEEKNYINTNVPSALQEALRATLYDAVNRPDPMPVTFVWFPAASWQIEICEVAGTAASKGGISVILRSPVP